MKISVFNIQRYSLHDGSGIRTTVFFKGCPLACAWCANPESQKRNPELFVQPEKCIGCKKCIEICPLHLKNYGDEGCTQCLKCAELCYSGAKVVVGKEYEIDEIMDIIEKDRVFYRYSNGGVTFSGGEPFLQPEALLKLAKKIKESGISTAVETCGYVQWENMVQVIPYLDQILYDIKFVDTRSHLLYTGVNNGLILDNLCRIARICPEKIIIRLPLISGINDDNDNLASLIGLMQANHLKRVDLLPFHRLGENKYKKLGREIGMEFNTPEPARLKEICRLFSDNGIQCNLYG